MKTTITAGSSWHLFKEHLWRNPEMTGTGSLRGGLTTRPEQCKEPFFPALCPHCTPMTSLGKAASASSNSSPRNIPATHNQNYQAPSPTQQPTPPLKWKLKPRAFWLCDEGADKQRQPWFPGRGDRNEGSNAWLGRSDVWFSSAQVSPFAYLCTQGAGVFAEALAARWRYHRDWRLLFRKWPRNVVTHRSKCSFTHASAEEMISPSVPQPQLPRFQKDRTQQMEQKLMLLSFCKAGRSTWGMEQTMFLDNNLKHKEGK